MTPPAGAWVHPDLRGPLADYRAVVGRRGVHGIADIGERRALHARLSRQAAETRSIPDTVTVSDHEVTGASDAPAVRMRLYTPQVPATSGGGSAWVYLHGGGLTLGDLDTSHLAAGNLAADSGSTVLSVDYRLAPETIFPGALEDCVAALGWLHARAADFGINARRIGVYGASAGGALAAALTQRSCDGQAAPVAKQMLIYPMLDDRATSDPAGPDAPDGTWARSSNAEAWEMYLGPGVDRSALPPHAVPARATSLKGLPPTYLEVGSADILAVEVTHYAARLIADAVLTELHVHPGAYHAFDVVAPTSAVTARARGDRLRAMGDL